MSDYGKIQNEGEKAKEIVVSSFVSRPLFLYLTITRETAFWLNKCVIDNLFKDDVPLQQNVAIDQEKVIDLYSGLRAMVTRSMQRNEHG